MRGLAAAVALLLLAVPPASVQGQGLAVSMNGLVESFAVPVEGQEQETTLYAGGRDVTLVAYVILGERRTCERRDFGSMSTLTATLVLPRPGTAVGGPTTQTFLLAPSLRSDSGFDYVTLRWPLRVSGSGYFPGSLVASATSAAGDLCAGHQIFNLAAVSGAPTLRVQDAVFDRGLQEVLIAVKARLPGLSGATGATYDATFEPLEALMLRLGRHGRLVGPDSAFGFGDDGISCVEFGWPHKRAPRKVGYTLRVPGSRDRGFPSQHRQGLIGVARRPTNAVEQDCVDLAHL